MPYKSATFLFPKLLVNFKVTTFLPIRAIIARIIFLHIQWECFLMNDWIIVSVSCLVPGMFAFRQFAIEWKLLHCLERTKTRARFLQFLHFCIFAVNLVINLSDNWTGLRQTRIFCVLGGWWIKISEFFRLIHSLANSESAFCIFTRFFASIDLKNISFYFSYLSALRITEHAKKRTQDLSGGTKRKVTVFYKIMYVRPIFVQVHP